MASVLQFNQYIGGADNVQVEIVFPSNQKTYVYDFNQDITDWSFSLDYQTIIANQVSYDRYSGDPNFANTKIIGTFNAGTVDPTSISVINALTGKVAVTIPGNLYTGPIIPDARSHIPITIVSLTWMTRETPPTVQTHRWALLQSWEPGVPVGDPVLAPGYIAITVEV